MKLRAKLCGFTTPDDIDAAAAAGAAYIGLVFFEKSPRNVAIETARSLAIHAPVGLAKVALVVNADDAALDRITDRVPLDMLQLHGSESPQRVAAVKARYGLPVMKALGVASRADVARAQLYSGVADQLLLDAKPPEGEALPGGNGLSFDWRLLEGESWSVPWMLAGGLTPDNVAEAVRRSAARQVDVSSGIETAPGQKSAELMAKFVSEANR